MSSTDDHNASKNDNSPTRNRPRRQRLGTVLVIAAFALLVLLLVVFEKAGR